MSVPGRGPDGGIGWPQGGSGFRVSYSFQVFLEEFGSLSLRGEDLNYIVQVSIGEVPPQHDVGLWFLQEFYQVSGAKRFR